MRRDEVNRERVGITASLEQHPQTSSGGAFGGGGGGGEPGRVGLTRFRSAPATWFDTLLQDDESLMSNQSLPPIPATDSNLSILRTTSALSSADPIFLDAAIASSGLGFFRQNSSPADFLAEASLDSDGFFSNFGIPANLDHPPLPKNPANKLQQERGTPAAAEFSSQLEGEQSVQLPGGVPSFTDVDMDKLLDESVPFRVRAKRGCATHPRSIAERVRRTRISDRIRKLQELVPNMDKQTNTADMLDEAVEYVKSLQKQIQELTENQRKCKCSIRE